jgi:hypothetical protein
VIPLQRFLALAIVIAVAAQFFLAGAGSFGATSYSTHRALGMALGIAAAAALLTALITRRHLVASSLLLGAVVIQIALGSLGTTHAWFGAFHGLNALFVLATAGNLARRTARPALATGGHAETAARTATTG